MEHTETEILKMSLEEAYSLFLVERKNLETSEDVGRDDVIIIKSTYKQARFGIKVQFDIHDYFNEIYWHKAKCSKVKIGGDTFYREEFYTEIEERETLIKGFLIGLIGKENPIITNKRYGR